MSAVKNLRAMFEQKGETSPPDRGRSPGIPPSIGSESPQPLSKVRTNFIAIEKDGRIGLQREPSQDSVLSSTRKVSGDTDASASAPVPANQETPNSTTDNMMRFPQNPPPLGRPPFAPRMDIKGAPPGSSKTSQNEKNDTPAEPSRGPKNVERDSTPKQTPATNGSSDAWSTSTNTTAVNGKGKEKAVEKDNPKASTSSAVKSAPKPLNVPSASKAPAKPAKSPTVSKAPRLATKTPERGVRQPEKAETPAMANSSKPFKSSSVKRPPPLQHTSSPGFVKPKPKSPTRPVKLPPGLTTHTAASGSKVGNPRQSASRGSTLSAGDSVGRSPSRTSVSTAGTATRTAESRTIKRQSSSIGRPRPSLGPPPKQAARDHPPTKKEREVDEKFLARMTRPTQASASKTQEKVATTPPRKHTATATATAAKKPVTKASTANTARRVVPKAPTVVAAEAQPQAESQTMILPTPVVVANTATSSANTQDEDRGSQLDLLGVRSFADPIVGEQSGAQGVARQAENIYDAEDDKVSDTTFQPAAKDDAEAQPLDESEDAGPPAAEIASLQIDKQPVIEESEGSSDEYDDEVETAEIRSEPSGKKGIYVLEKERDIRLS